MPPCAPARAQVSVEYGAWAVSGHNQAVLSDAFRTAETVVLLLTMPQTGGFQGYALMGGAVGQYGGALAWPGFTNARANFAVSWQQLVDVPYALLQLQLQALGGAMTRDGQEVPRALGEQMVSRCRRRATGPGRAAPWRAKRTPREPS